MIVIIASLISTIYINVVFLGKSKTAVIKLDALAALTIDVAKEVSKTNIV